MGNTDRISGQRAAVIGMAKSGVAAAALLREHGALEVRPVDQKPGPGVLPQIEASLRDVDLIVISPGVPADLPLLLEARSRGVSVIGELELAAPYLQGRTIGITGANGKTTTTALIGHILRECGIPAQVGGNIGTAPAAMAGSSRPDQWNVLELSSFQLETVETFRAHIAVCLNVTPDHLDRHYTFENYAAAKRRLFETQQPGDFAVLNAEDPTCTAYAGATPASVLWFSSSREVSPGLWLDAGAIRFDQEILMPAGEVPLRGRHNLENVMAAAAAARLAGAPLPEIAAAVRTFPGVEHRLEFVRELHGVAYYNDSKATNVDATLKALEAFPGGLWVILGGKDKGSDYTPLRAPLAAKAEAALLIGAAASKIEDHLAGAANVLRCETLDRAVAHAHRHAPPGGTVLLAPACASFDQFENYEQRGRIFKRLVMELT